MAGASRCHPFRAEDWPSRRKTFLLFLFICTGTYFLVFSASLHSSVRNAASVVGTPSFRQQFNQIMPKSQNGSTFIAPSQGGNVSGTSTRFALGVTSTQLPSIVVHLPRPMVAPSQGYLCSATRLGNKMFLLATAITTAINHNMTFVWVQPVANCKWIPKLQEIFVNLARVPSISYTQVTRWKQSNEGGDPNVFKVIPVTPTNENVIVGGYRQSWKYFSSPSEQQAVRKLFTFSTYYEEHVRKVFTAIHTTFSSINKPILVGLHMRLGDLLTIKNGKRVADKPFFDNVLKAVKSHFNGSDNLIFVASSDSPNVGKEKLADAKKLYNIFWLSGTDLEDFATLSKCNHSITSGGTFGFWTSWLAGGETFYNANVSIAGSSFDKRYISDNFNLPTWIPVSWI